MQRNTPAQQSIALARQRLAGRQIPRGAPRGAIAGQAQMQAQMPAVPQGADQGNLAGCGDNYGCGSGYIASPFAGIPYNQFSSHRQGGALLGLFVQPVTTEPVSLEISCGNSFFYGCGARAFTPPNTILLTSIISGFDSRDQLCPGSGIDVAFFATDDCYCPFDFGCFSNLAPLQITFDPIDTQSVLQPLNMVIVGDRLEFDGCFPYPPGLVPTPATLPGIQWQPGLPVTPAPAEYWGPGVVPPAVNAPMQMQQALQANPGYAGYPMQNCPAPGWGQRM